MKSAALYLLLLGLPLLGLAENPPTGYVHNAYYDEDHRTKHDVIFGYRAKIAFVVFLTNDGTPSRNKYPLEHLKVKADPDEPGLAYCEGSIELPDGTKRDLPSSKMAFEYTNGVFRASAPIDMTTDEFSRYLGSVEKTSLSVLFSVDGLKTFEKKVKTEPSNKSVEPTRAPTGARGSP